VPFFAVIYTEKGVSFLEWIKVTVRHAEYDFVGAPDNVFRAWIMAMILTAAMEKIPTQNQMENRLGKDNYQALVKYLKENNAPLEKVLKKVMEDVAVVNQKRKHNSKYMSEYRSGATRGTPQGHHVKGKIREEKIREDKTVFKGLKELAKKDPVFKKNLVKIGLKV